LVIWSMRQSSVSSDQFVIRLSKPRLMLVKNQANFIYMLNR
jgi:hypothetical protein